MRKKKIVLAPRKMRWITGQKDDPEDMCAHGRVQFEIDGRVLVSEKDGEWTVSASAIYLLRTMEADHTKEKPLFDNVFPCCGFNMYDIEGEDDVLICGCPAGIDFEIIHETNNIRIKPDNQPSVLVTLEDWRKAVVRFSDLVMKFYSSSASKNPKYEEDKKGFEKFISEWKRRHRAAINA